MGRPLAYESSHSLPPLWTRGRPLLSQLAASLATRSQNCLTNEVPIVNIMTYFMEQALTSGDALHYVWLLNPPGGLSARRDSC